MQRIGWDAPLPDEMQGRWIAVDEPATELVVAGGDVAFRGVSVAYDHKEIDRVEGALTVSLKVDDPREEDSFQRRNITELVITPEGKFHAYNVKFGCQFVRSEA